MDEWMDMNSLRVFGILRRMFGTIRWDGRILHHGIFYFISFYPFRRYSRDIEMGRRVAYYRLACFFVEYSGLVLIVMGEEKLSGLIGK